LTLDGDSFLVSAECIQIRGVAFLCETVPGTQKNYKENYEIIEEKKETKRKGWKGKTIFILR